MSSLKTDPPAHLLTGAEMRAIERAAMASGRVTGLELMERAGAGVVAATLAASPDLAARPRRAIVLCGPGNNGGDGFVIARLLHDRGWTCDVRLMGQAEGLPPDARANHDRWRALGEVRALRPDALDAPEGWQEAALVVDALFGTGLTRPLAGLGAIGRAMRAEGGPRIVAVDIPSGLCADSGRFLRAEGRGDGEAAFRADLTVTFHATKLGHVLAEGPAACGRVVVADIGLDADPPAGAVRLAVAPDADRLAKAGGHKYGHGHAVILSGPMGRSGAARLAARGALRVGAGLVTVAAPPSAMAECAARLTAIMLRECGDAAALSALLRDGRINAVCLGPGLGTGADTRDLVAAALGRGGRAGDPGARGVVLDADALTAFEGDPPALFDALHPQAVLTPHGGEFARLFPDLSEKLAAPAATGPAFSRVDAARAAAARAGCVVLLKGPDTVIADPSGRCSINAAVQDRAAPWLATAGSGDVLAGIIAGLLARGFPAFDAAEAGAWLHVEAARAFGPGLVAEDIPEALPRVFRDVLRQAGMVSGSADASSSPSA